MATLLKVLNNLADIKSAGGVAPRVRTQGPSILSQRNSARTSTRSMTSLWEWSPKTASSGSTVSTTKASSPSPTSVSKASSNCSKSIENKNPANADPHPQAPSQGPTPEGY